MLFKGSRTTLPPSKPRTDSENDLSTIQKFLCLKRSSDVPRQWAWTSLVSQRLREVSMQQAKQSWSCVMPGKWRNPRLAEVCRDLRAPLGPSCPIRTTLSRATSRWSGEISKEEASRPLWAACAKVSSPTHHTASWCFHGTSFVPRVPPKGKHQVAQTAEIGASGINGVLPLVSWRSGGIFIWLGCTESTAKTSKAGPAA